MDENFKYWQGLHMRFVRGEPLSKEEQAYYHTELARMDAEELEEGREAYERGMAELKNLRDEMLAAEAENKELRERIERNRQRIAAREAALSDRDKELLGIGR